MAGCPSVRQLEAHAAGKAADSSIEGHVAGCAACRDLIAEIHDNNRFLLGVAGNLAKAWDAPPRVAVTADAAPTAGHGRPRDGSMPNIEGYTLTGELSQGGQGVVYRAVQVETKRPAAIKMLITGSFASERQRQRFDREIEIAARFRHPNLVSIFESGQATDGRRYVAMELVEGLPLDRAIEMHGEEAGPAAGGSAARTGAPVPRRVDAIMRLFSLICAGVGHAHAYGVIHRDLKPSNILVDGTGNPRILDFGLARPADASYDVTATRDFVGTPAFCSPEQLSRDPGALNARTDVYALGLLLYRSLTGKHPYPCDGPLHEVARHAIETDPTPPTRYVPRMDMDVQTIVLKCLAKDPARRYATASALAADINDYLAGRPISARRDSLLYVLGKLAVRHRIPVIAGLLVLVTVVGAAVGFSLFARELRRGSTEQTGPMRKSTRLGLAGGIRTELVLVDGQTVIYNAGGGAGVYLCSAPTWTPTLVYSGSLSNPVYDAKRRRLVGSRGAGLATLTLGSDGTWSPAITPLTTDTRPQGRVSLDTRDPGADPKEVAIYFRASNGRIYVWEFAAVLTSPVTVRGWKLTEVTDTPGGDPVFDNFNTGERSLFFRGRDGALHRSVCSGETGQWTTTMIHSEVLGGDPVINTSMSVVYADSSGRVSSTWWNGAQWTTEHWNETANIASPLVLGDRGTAYYTDARRNLWKCSWGGSAFVSTKLTESSNVRGESLCVNSLGHVYYCGMDDGLWRY